MTRLCCCPLFTIIKTNLYIKGHRKLMPRWTYKFDPEDTNQEALKYCAELETKNRTISH